MQRNYRAVNTTGSRTVAGSTHSESGGGTLRRANDEAFAVVLDLGLRQRIEIGNDLGPGGYAAGSISKCSSLILFT